jgi:ankyrin repeat protein
VSSVSSNQGGDLKDDAGETPLHLACIGGDAQLVTALLSSGATVDARATGPKSLRMTPLTWCAYGGHDDAVEVLLTEGKADPNLVVDDEQGNQLTALDIALRVGDSLGGRHIRTRALLEHAGGKKAAELS